MRRDLALAAALAFAVSIPPVVEAQGKAEGKGTASTAVATTAITPQTAPGSTTDQKKDTTDAGTRSPVSGFSDETYPEAFKALFLLFVLAAVLESALAILFNWRPFVETFNARAVRPLVSLAFALLVVYMFGLDLVTALAKLIRPNVPALDDTGRILTAMVLAGGSAAVNNLMVGLGFRQVRTPETVVAKPPLDKGWISVAIVRTPAEPYYDVVRQLVAAGARVEDHWLADERIGADPPLLAALTHDPEV